MLAEQVHTKLIELAPELEASATDAAPQVLVAVSGGADSVALLRLLHAAGVPLAVAHFDHALRVESAADAEFVASLAGELDVPFISERADVAGVSRQRGWNLEAGARRLRYAFLARAAKQVGARVIATGHTRDDQAETVLLQLLRGSAYLRGMPPRRGHIVRPLLERSRDELRAYLASIGQPYRHDASNLDTRRTRAWLRADVLPLLRRRAPDIDARLARLAGLQADQAAALGELARAVVDSGARTARLLRQPVAVQREALARLLRTAGVAVDAERIEAVRAALPRSTPTRVQVARDAFVRVAYGRVEVVRAQGIRGHQPPEAAERPVRSAAELPAGVPPTALEHPDLVLRRRRPGDRIRLPGGSKKLSDLFIDLKIPREERDELLLLASGSEVLWIEGVAMSAQLGGGVLPDDDAVWMARALELARGAAAAGETPVGALVVRDGKILAEARNETEARGDASAHAELLALRRAAERTGDWRLGGATLYVTLEPCPMCYGAVLQTHVQRLVYGADNLREGALGSVMDLSVGRWKRRPEVRGGVLARAGQALLEEFFAGLRASVEAAEEAP